jgi:imidazolonepropionase-like amidohydrolase
VDATIGAQAVCDGAESCRRIVREQVARGADIINFYNTGSINDVTLTEQSMTDAEMQALVQTAHDLGRKVVADGHTARGINAALRAGADIIDTAPWPDNDSWVLLKKTGAFLEPHVHAFVVAGAAATGTAPADARVREVLSRPFAAQVALQNGINLAYGSDTGIVQHGDNASDLEELVRLGASPMQAIEIATVNSAAAVGMRQSIGSLEPGKYADLIATRDDPLKDIRALRRISAVMRQGQLIRGSAPSKQPSALIVWTGQLLLRPDDAPRLRQSIVVRNGRIDQIVAGYLPATALRAPRGDVQLLDLSNQFVLAGLMDLHVHLSTEPGPAGIMDDVSLSDAELALRIAHNARRTLEAGFTTVLDMGTGRRAHEEAIYAVRDAIRAGDLIGPQILAVGSPISIPGNSRTSRFRTDVETVIGPQGVCSGADDCRRAVREQVHRGADVINFYNTGSLLAPGSPAQTFTDEEMRAIVDAAHSLHRKAIADGAGKPSSASGINAALKAGADWIDTGIYPDATTWQLLLRRHGSYTPHLYAVMAAVGDTAATLSQGSMGWLPESILQSLFSLKQQTPAAAEALRRGIPMALASDAGVFAHGQNSGELLEYVKLGMTPAQAIAAATMNAAQLLGLAADRGSIEVGKRADFIAVDADPLTDIRQLLKVRTIVSGGLVVKQ